MNLERLKQQWIPLMEVKKISSRPQRVFLLGLPLVVYKVGEEVSVLLDRCPHRGAPLSAGRMEGNRLKCSYHGWHFDPSGQCVAIPGLVKPSRLDDKNVPAFQTQMHRGLLFVCLDEHDSTLPLYEATAPQAYRTHFTHFEMEGDILDIIENTLDATHTHYVHAGLLRHDKKRQTVSARLSVKEHSAEVLYEEEHKQSGLVSSLFESNRNSSIGRFHFPLIAELEYYSKEQLTASFTFYLSPMKDNKHRVFLFISYPYYWLTSWLKKTLILPFIKLALKQDKAILKKLEGNRRYFPNATCKSTELDLLRPHIERIFDNKSERYEKTIQMNI